MLLATKPSFLVKMLVYVLLILNYSVAARSILNFVYVARSQMSALSVQQRFHPF